MGRTYGGHIQQAHRTIWVATWTGPRGKHMDKVCIASMHIRKLTYACSLETCSHDRPYLLHMFVCNDLYINRCLVINVWIIYIDQRLISEACEYEQMSKDYNHTLTSFPISVIKLVQRSVVFVKDVDSLIHYGDWNTADAVIQKIDTLCVSFCPCWLAEFRTI